MEIKAIVTASLIVVFFMFESIWPFYSFGVNRLRHGAVNIAAGLTSYALSTLFFYYLVVSALSVDKGLVSLFPGWLGLASAIVMFDLWMYVWHRMNHEIPFLWRFHKAHHSDTAMDVTTGLRFHPVELLLSTGARLPVYMFLGMNIYNIDVYEAIAGAVVLFHHSNISLPERADRLLSFLIPTPRMHKVHHSDKVSETNSNYGTLFSFWDRVFGTFNSRVDVKNVKIGLKEYRGEEYQSFIGFIKTPFM